VKSGFHAANWAQASNDRPDGQEVKDRFPRRTGWALIVLATLLTAACATGSGGDDDIFEGGRLSVALVDASSFQLSRSAYVARFEIHNRRGVAMLFPSSESENRKLEAGVHRQMTYADRDFIIDQKRLWNQVSGRPISQLDEPQVLVVASEFPINLNRIMERPDALRDLMGQDFYNGRTAPDVIIRLIQEANGSAGIVWDLRHFQRVDSPGSSFR
jgi:predicted small secreted protein